MKRFQFSLQALGTLRERQEQLALQTYAKVLQTWESARGKVGEAQSELEAGCEEFRRQATGTRAASDLARMRAYCHALEQRKQTLEHAAQIARRKAGQAFTALLAARRARAVVDKFHDNQSRAHRRARQRHDQRSLDEMVNHQGAVSALTSLAGDNQWSQYDENSAS